MASSFQPEIIDKKNQNIPLEMLQKQLFVDVIQDKCSCKFCKFRRKTPMLESLFDKVAGLYTCNLIKKRFQHRSFPVNLQNF